MALAQITTHQADAQARLLEQYKDKPSLLALLSAIVGRTQVVESALWALYLGRKLSGAVAAQLDGIGKIVGLPRSQVPSAADDAVYRVWLLAWIKVNYSSGTIPDLIALFTAIAAPGTSINIFNSGPASFVARLGAVVQTQGPALISVLSNVKAAGVNGSLDYLATLPAFGFDGAGAGMDTGYFGGSV